MDFRTQISQMGLTKPDAYTPYAAGAKQYGFGQNAPNEGTMNEASQRQGYRERDMAHQAKRNAYLNRMKAAQNGNYMSSAWLGNG